MNILAIGAHPDDIEFGCGGALIKFSKKKANIFLLILTRGEVGGRPHIREAEQRRATKFIKAKRVFWGGFSDTHIPTNRKLIDVIEKVILEVNPEIVFFNYFDDIHQDHRAIAEGATSATRYSRNVLMYEVPTTQNFQPDVFVNIGDTLKNKLKLLGIFSSQLTKTRVKNLTILESAKSCANFRGFQARVKYAEGFKALRFNLKI
jgi:LmbE family N-acetylglucosaminyl deacetylase